MHTMSARVIQGVIVATMAQEYVYIYDVAIQPKKILERKELSREESYSMKRNWKQVPMPHYSLVYT